MAQSRVRLPNGVGDTYTVYLNGVRQERGVDFRVERRRSVFRGDLAKEGKLGFWRWFWGAWGIGTYKKNDQVDVAWEVDGGRGWPTRSTSSASCSFPPRHLREGAMRTRESSRRRWGRCCCGAAPAAATEQPAGRGRT